ncbi:hypothetical protein WJX74_003658 [Apatococcus lobatus]|uniref:Uncharacterized protein n=1 Tax=Apatococcus lobatus TaxID=904363 RepID=A0AAW1QXI8_9CHLO
MATGHFPADIKGVGSSTQHFYQPARCQTTTTGIWGEFDYPDTCCGSNNGKPGANHEESSGAGSRLLAFPQSRDVPAGPTLPITPAAFLLVGSGPLNTPAFSLLNPDGVIDIGMGTHKCFKIFVTIVASGPDVLLTAQLTGYAFVWAYDSVHHVFYAAHINPASTNPNSWAQNGKALANALTVRPNTRAALPRGKHVLDTENPARSWLK